MKASTICARGVAFHLLLGAVTAAALCIPTQAHSQAASRRFDRVPGDFATLQEAVDLGRAPVILVASGEYAGATVDRRVALVCHGQCMIASGPAFGAVQAGFVLTGGADGTRIQGFDFVDVDLGVFASCQRVGSAPNDVAITGNAFVNTSQAVTVNALDCEGGGGSGWRIERNRVHDLRSDISDCGGGLGIYLIAVSDAEISRNVFRGEIAAPPCGAEFMTAGVYVSGSSDVRITANDFELGDGGHTFKLDVALFPEDGANEDVVLAFNDARGSAAPFEGVNFYSFDSFGVRARCNSGTTALEHAGSEGTSERYMEIGCRRRSAP